jgi:hypothetical protein
VSGAGAFAAAGTNVLALGASSLPSCLANGIDGYRYLTARLIALPKARTVADYEALLPWRLAAANR